MTVPPGPSDWAGPGEDKVRVVHCSATGQHHVLARVDLCPGQPIAVFDGTPKPQGRLTLMIAEEVHVESSGPLAMLNHSCCPNVALAFPAASYSPEAVADLVGQGRVEALFPTVVALKAIPAGTELTFHYGTTEWEVAAPFACTCGSEACCGTVRGYKHMSPAQRRSVSGQVAPHVERACGHPPPGSVVGAVPAWRGRRVRVCVLVASYAECTDETKELDDFACSPALYFPDAVSGDGVSDGVPLSAASRDTLREAGFPTLVSTPHFVFSYVPVRKSNAYPHVRDLVASGAYDVFFNLCDGALDSDSAGVEVVQVCG